MCCIYSGFSHYSDLQLCCYIINHKLGSLFQFFHLNLYCQQNRHLCAPSYVLMSGRNSEKQKCRMCLSIYYISRFISGSQ